jgi:hypothetical protein
MKTAEQIAKAAYEAYLKQAQRSDAEGLAGHALSWDELDEGGRQCWLAVVKQVAAELALAK